MLVHCGHGAAFPLLRPNILAWDHRGWRSTMLCITAVPDVAHQEVREKISLDDLSQPRHHRFSRLTLKEPCIIGLDLRAKWEVMVKVPKATLYLGQLS